MKKAIFAISLIILIQSAPASALIIDIPTVEDEGRFKDTRTGYIWYDLDTFYDGNFNDNVLQFSSGRTLPSFSLFHLATKEEVQTLEYSLAHLTEPFDPMIFFKTEQGWNASNLGHGPRGRIVSWYEDGNVDDGIAWVKGSIFHDEFPWEFEQVALDPMPDPITDHENYQLWLDAQRSATSFDGIGAMVVDTSNAIVPEPATIFLLSSGLLGTIFRRKRLL